ncbi:MAG TPA: glutamate 5-kinase [Actinomycetota bacterium]|nr:glutamate 5-kinase [Actinomycetota bacterium]
MTRPLAEVRRLVVKVGSSSLVDDAGVASRPRLAKVVRDVAGVLERRSCVLVSSGAIASGLESLGLSRRPRDMPSLQAAAAVGQGRLMAEYARLFARRGVVAAQVLLTQDDFVRRRHYVNARNTLERLLRAGAVPVVNENDTVATAEITFGDNDRLAALVAAMIGADLLILLSDVDGIYTSDPRRGRARLLAEVTDPLAVRATGPGTGAAKGGMASKLEAAGVATAAGVGVVVAGASRRDVVARILTGDPVGTWLPPRGSRRGARKTWLAFATGVRGRILVDAGAERALREHGRSLLAAGVTAVEGEFAAGDPVEIAGPSGAAFARGIANYSSDHLPALAGRSSGDLASAPGGPYDGEVVHRDELVVIG